MITGMLMWIAVCHMDKIHQVYTTVRNTSKRIQVVLGRRLTKNQATTRPDYWWPDMWSGMSNAAYMEERQQWAIDEPKLDNAASVERHFFYRSG